MHMWTASGVHTTGRWKNPNSRTRRWVSRHAPHKCESYVWGFEWKSLTRAAFNTIVALGTGYTYAVKVWDLSIVQGPFSIVRAKTFCITIRNFFHRCGFANRRPR
jgi:hypothetical protein